MNKHSIGIDVGATTVKLGIVASSGEIIHRREIKADASSGPDRFVESLTNSIKELINESGLGKSRISGIGIGCPSWDGHNKAVGEAANLPALKGLKLGKAVESRMSLPTFVDNDANAAAEGERIFGGWGEADRNMVVYTLGTGVGSGVIHTDPETGVTAKITGHKLRGGELGHVTIPVPPGRKSRNCTCGHHDCLEAHASATAVAKIAEERVGQMTAHGEKSRIEHFDAEHVAKAADEGDRLALEIEDETAHALAEGIRNAVHTFDPEIVVIAGKMGIRWKRLVEKAIKKYRAMKNVVPSGDVRIEISRLENAGILGAAALTAPSMKTPT